MLCASGGDRLLHRFLEDRDQQVVLASEVQIDRACGDAGRARHVGHLCIEEAACREGRGGGPQQGIALVGFVRRSGGRTGTAGSGDGHE